ncbi:MAG: thymidine phosphorylase [Deltaproteobacteria bacterium]|nr:thymidine phosphorylase [Deltaproteobacteria bacterium]
MRPQDIIRTKRERGQLTAEQIEFIIQGVTDGSIPDYQLAALLMAIFLHGLDDDELRHWTAAMVNSGRVVDLSRIAPKKVDKHSTGGVGDKVSICLAPIVAACGVAVPMISGRGLGHTGGTLDKLEAIPGFSTALTIDRFTDVVEQAGLALIGQTDDLAPADRRLYALRDITSTVESIPLIASSIMSKKIAEGIDGLVLDVKVGSGAFMKDLSSARELAKTLCAIGNGAKKAVAAVLSDMSQPLGRAIGNANETREAIEVLHGKGPADLVELTLVLASEMLMLAGEAPQSARQRVETARNDGSALAALRRCVELQNGDTAVVDDPSKLTIASQTSEVLAAREGYLSQIDCEQVGIAAMLLGAGRLRLDSKIDHSVGLTYLSRLGERVTTDTPLFRLHHNDKDAAQRATARLQQAITISDAPRPAPPLVYETIR